MLLSYDITYTKYYVAVNLDVNLPLLNVVQFVWNKKKNYENLMSPKIFKKGGQTQRQICFFQLNKHLQCIVCL